MADELKVRIERERLRNVTLTGLLAAEQLKQQYQRADIFLFPSAWEGSPKVLLEAAACGLPVIARRDYQPETVIHGQTGFLTSSDDEVFSRLQELLSHSDRRPQFGEPAPNPNNPFSSGPLT